MNLSISQCAALRKIFPDLAEHEPMRAHTTLGVGGPARYFAVAATVGQLIDGVPFCAQHRLPCRVLGNGSNVVVSDNGYPGLLILNRASDWEVLPETPEPAPPPGAGTRFTPVGPDSSSAKGLPDADRDAPVVAVRVASGARIAPLMKALFRAGITGLQWFAGIPATVGGATYMNMHGGPVFFGDLVRHARLLRGTQLAVVDRSYLQFDYDYSVLHETREIVLDVELLLRRGDVAAAQRVAREWARRKAIQPQRSAGCIFQNLTESEQQRLGLPTPSAGYLIDQVLGMKGQRLGDAIISPRHAAFIENLGQARAAEVHALVCRVRERAQAELQVALKLEIEFIGDF